MFMRRLDEIVAGHQCRVDPSENPLPPWLMKKWYAPSRDFKDASGWYN